MWCHPSVLAVRDVVHIHPFLRCARRQDANLMASAEIVSNLESILSLVKR
jgi:hypothetical protein